MEEVYVVRHRHLVEGVPIRRLAREMGVSKNTIKRYLRGAAAGIGKPRGVAGAPVLGRGAGAVATTAHDFRGSDEIGGVFSAMGYFDYSCALTGLSLRGEDAVAIWVCEVEPGRWVPAALPLRGNYDRLGAIDGIVEDAKTRILARQFDIAVRTSKIELGGHAKLDWKERGDKLATAVRVVERGTTMKIGDVRFAGRPLAHVLVHRGVYDATVAAHPTPPAAAALERALPCPAARHFYDNAPPEHRQELEAAAVEVLRLAAYFSRWTPVGSTGQHGDRATLIGYRAAYAQFADTPWMIGALDQSAARFEKRSSCDLPDRWLTGSNASWYGAVVGNDERVAAASRADLAYAIWKVLRHQSDDALAEIEVEAFAVQRGMPEPAVDVRDAIRARDNATGRCVKPSDRSGWAVAIEDADSIEVDPAGLANLPDLDRPVLASGPALFVVPEPPPAWLRSAERGACVIAHADIEAGARASWYGARLSFTGTIPGKKHLAASSLTMLADKLRTHIAPLPERELLALRVDAFAVVCGEPTPEADLRAAIVLADAATSRSARLDDEDAVIELVTSPGAIIAGTVDEAALARLPELPEPLARADVYLMKDGEPQYFSTLY